MVDANKSLVEDMKKASKEAEELNEKEYQLRKNRVEYEHHQLQERIRRKNAFSNLP